jgi:hypothetical protein
MKTKPNGPTRATLALLNHIVKHADPATTGWHDAIRLIRKRFEPYDKTYVKPPKERFGETIYVGE